MAGPSVIDVDQQDFESRVIEASKTVPVVVDFWAGWCRPCLVLGPILERLADEYGGRFVLAKVDMDANQELSSGLRRPGDPRREGVQGREGGGGVRRRPAGAGRPPVHRLDRPRPTADDLVGVAPRGRRGSSRVRRCGRRWSRNPATPAYPRRWPGCCSIAGTRRSRGHSAASPSPELTRIQAELDLRRRRVERRRARRGRPGRAPGAIERRWRVRWRRLSRRWRSRPSRELMVRLFDLLGEEHPLTREFRPRLASALF